MSEQGRRKVENFSTKKKIKKVKNRSLQKSKFKKFYELSYEGQSLLQNCKNEETSFPRHNFNYKHILEKEMKLSKELFGVESASLIEKNEDYTEEEEVVKEDPESSSTDEIRKLKEIYEESNFRPKWADEESTEIKDSLSNKTSTYLRETGSVLPKKQLDYKHLGLHLYGNGKSDGYELPLFAIDFNENLNLALVARSTKNLGVLTLFQFDGINSHQIKSINYPRFPINSATFIDSGTKIVSVSGQSGKIMVYDIAESTSNEVPYARRGINNKKVVMSPNGECLAIICTDGSIMFYNIKSMSRMEDVQLPINTKTLAFDNEGSRAFAIGNSSRVFVIDMSSFMVVHAFYDHGCIEGTTVALSPNGKWIACGSNTGIVNIYDLDAVLKSENPLPLKSFGSLTTYVTNLQFNPTSEILAMVSNDIMNAVKLVHLQSLEVFQNFPGLPGFPTYNKIVSFSWDSKFLAVGAKRGTINLVRLHHY